MIPALGPRSLRRFLEGLSRMLGIEQILERLRAVEQHTQAAENSISAEIEGARQMLQALEKRTAEMAQRQDSDLSGLRSVLAERVQYLETAVGAGEAERGRLGSVFQELKAGNENLVALLEAERIARARLEAALEAEAALRAQVEERLADELQARTELSSSLANEVAARSRIESAVTGLESRNAELLSRIEAEKAARQRLETAVEAEAILRAGVEERLGDEQRARTEISSTLSNEAAARSRIEAALAGLEASHGAAAAKIDSELGALRNLVDAHRALEASFAKEAAERAAMAARLGEEQAARHALANSVAKALDLQRNVDELRAAADGERAARDQAIAGLSATQKEADKATHALREALESHRNEVSGRIEGVGSEMGSLVASVREQARQSVDALGHRLAGMESALVSMREQGAALETRLSNLSGGLEEASEAHNQIGVALRDLSARTASVDGALKGLHDAREKLRSLEQYIKHVDGQITRIDTKNARQDNVTRSTLLRLFASEKQPEVRIPVVSFSRSTAMPFANLCSPGSADAADVYFVCSNGRTATHWLTAVLNADPDFIAAHGPVSPPRLIGSQRYSESGDATVANADAFRAKPLDAIRAGLVAVGTARRYAMIQGFSLAELYLKMSGEPSTTRVRAVNIVRHPVARAQSFWMHWRFQEEGRRDMARLLARWDQPSAYGFYKSFVSARFPKVDLSQTDARLFIIALHWVMRDLDDFVLPAEHFPIEWLLQGWKHFDAFLDITFGRAGEARATMQKAYRELPRLNAMAAQPQTPAQIYGAWEPWQRALFAGLCEEYQLPAIYGRFGYEFSFLAAGRSTRK